jgi:peptide chain release factor subunit 1
MFDQRLQRIIIKTVDVSYGGENGFNQAIELSADALRDVKFIQEKNLIGKFFEEIAQDTGKYCFGIRDTIHALDGGSVEKLIVFEDLDMNRWVLKSAETKKEKVLFLTPEQEKEKNHFKDENGQDYEVVEKTSIVEWFAGALHFSSLYLLLSPMGLDAYAASIFTENYKKFGCTLHFITNKSQEGAQFLKGFGGIGGLLRYRMDFTSLDEELLLLGGDDMDGDREEDFDFDF